MVLILSTSVKVEVILGTTKDEGIIWLLDPIKNNSLFEEHQEDWDTKWGPLLMGIHDLDEATDEDLSNSYKLLDFYIGGLENLNEDHLQSMFDMYTDSAMLFGVNRSPDINLYFKSFIYFPSMPKMMITEEKYRGFSFISRTAELLLSHGVRVWQYILTHRGQNSITDLFGINEKVSRHPPPLIT